LSSANQDIAYKLGIIGRLIGDDAASGRAVATNNVIISHRYAIGEAEVDGVFLICGEWILTRISGRDRVVVLNGDIATVVPALHLLTAGEWSERIQ